MKAYIRCMSEYKNMSVMKAPLKALRILEQISLNLCGRHIPGERRIN